MAFSPLAYPGTRQTFFVSALAVAPASSKSMISLETTSANVVLRLQAIQVYNVQSSAVVGVNARPDAVHVAQRRHAAHDCQWSGRTDLRETRSTRSQRRGRRFTAPAVVAADYDIGARFCEVDP